jgi:hypothetical protein
MKSNMSPEEFIEYFAEILQAQGLSDVDASIWKSKMQDLVTNVKKQWWAKGNRHCLCGPNTILEGDGVVFCKRCSLVFESL